MTAARPAVAEVPDLSPAKPHARSTEVHRLTSVEGICLWGHLTPHPLEAVLAEGYFDVCHDRGGGLLRHDRLICTCSAESDLPEHCTLIVVDVNDVSGVKVALLVEATAA